jgi:hypothetical protein
VRALVAAVCFFTLGYAAGEWLTRREMWREREMDRFRNRLDDLEIEREQEVQTLRAKLAAQGEAEEPTAETRTPELAARG